MTEQNKKDTKKGGKGGKGCRCMASELIMKERADSLEKTKAELNKDISEEEENEKIKAILGNADVGNYREGCDPT